MGALGAETAIFGAPRGLEGPQGPQEVPQRGPGGVTADFIWASAGPLGPQLLPSAAGPRVGIPEVAHAGQGGP